MEIRWRYSRDTIEMQWRYRYVRSTNEAKAKCQTKLKSGRAVDPPHSDSLPPGEREPLDEIATGFALATTWSDCRALLAMTRGPGPRYLL